MVVRGWVCCPCMLITARNGATLPSPVGDRKGHPYGPLGLPLFMPLAGDREGHPYGPLGLLRHFMLVPGQG